METQLYFQMIKRGWWIILLVMLVALSVSLLSSYLAVPQYETTASFIITPNDSLATGTDFVRGLDTLDRASVITTFAEVMDSRRIYEETLVFLELQNSDLSDYEYQVTVTPDTSVMKLSVTGPNPEIAARLANSIGYQTINYTRQLNQVFDLNFLDDAIPPKTAFSPQPIRDASLALIIGLVSGIALAIVSEQLRIPLETYRQRLRLDSVTGVFNNRYFLHLVEDEIAQKPDVPLSIGVIELSGLQDLLGTLPVANLHWVLRKVTELLRQELRGNDVIGRWREVSFIVMLPNTTGIAASRIFERIFQALSIPVELGQLGFPLNLDPNIGGAEFAADISTQELLEKADDALENARRSTGTPPIYIWKFNKPFWASASITDEE